jgi:hypothetical protein
MVLVIRYYPITLKNISSISLLSGRQGEERERTPYFENFGGVVSGSTTKFKNIQKYQINICTRFINKIYLFIHKLKSSLP